MVTKNIFLVNTRFHLLVAQSIATKNNLTDLLLITTDESVLSDEYLYDSKLWSDCIYIKKISLTSPFSIFSFFRELKSFCGMGTVNLYWGNDYQIENQFIATYLKINEVTLFDDGIATYMPSEDRKKALTKKVLEFLVFGIFKRSLKNRVGIGYYPHHYHFSLYPELVSHTKTANVVEFNLSVPSSLKSHTSEMLGKLNINDDSYFFLTQPISEYSVMSSKKENVLIKRLIDNAATSLKLIVVKAHPSESTTRHLERVQIIKERFDGRVISCTELNRIPIEAFIDIEFQCTFISLYSTALINLKIMNNTHRCISGVCENDIGLINSLDEIIAIFAKFKVELLQRPHVI